MFTIRAFHESSRSQGVSRGQLLDAGVPERVSVLLSLLPAELESLSCCEGTEFGHVAFTVVCPAPTWGAERVEHSPPEVAVPLPHGASRPAHDDNDVMADLRLRVGSTVLRGDWHARNMKIIRVAWLFLALAVGGLGMIATYLASWPQSEFTSCEIDPAYDPVACNESLLDRGGEGYIAAMVLPAVLCTIPAFVPRRSVAWATVGVSVVAATVAFVMVGGVAMMCIAAAVPAIVLAAIHTRLAEQSPDPGSVNAQSFLERVCEQQRGE